MADRTREAEKTVRPARGPWQLPPDVFEAAAETVLDPLVVLEAIRDPAGAIEDLRCLYANEAALEELHLPRDQVVGEPVRTLIPDPIDSRLFELGVQIIDSGRPLWLHGARLREHPLFPGTYEMRARKLGDGVVFTWHDVTRQEATEARTRLQTRLLDLVDASVIATDPGFRITYWSKGAERLYGWAEEEVLGRTTLEVLAPWMSLEEYTEIPAGGRERRAVLLRKDGSRIPVDSRIAPLLEGGETVGFLGVSIDISERRAAEQELEEAHDLLETLTENMGEGLIAVDEVGLVTFLNTAAQRLLGWPRASLTGRSLHELTHFQRPDGSSYPVEQCPLSTVLKTGEVVQVERDLFFRRDGSAVQVAFTASGLHGDGIRGAVVVLRDVSRQLEEEQRGQQELEKLAWVGRIQDALDDDRFVLYAQPIMDLRTGEIVQHELLLRMLAPDGHVIPPALFLPVAEEVGLIRRIDQWVVEQALGLAAAGHPVEFNLSAHSVGDPHILETLRAGLASTGAPADNLVCEITETALIRDPDRAEAFVHSLRNLGCKVALDDFGVGYGGFAYLKRLPVSALKIDLQFVQDATREASSRHVIAAVVSLARAFGMVTMAESTAGEGAGGRPPSLETVAEGAEEPETLEVLRELGVDYVQGYAVARPRPVSEVFAPPPLD